MAFPDVVNMNFTSGGLDDDLSPVSVVVVSDNDYDDMANNNNMSWEGVPTAASNNYTRRELLEMGVQDLLEEWRYQVR